LDYLTGEVHGKILGIIGYGELGQAVARVATIFGMKVLVAARPHAYRRHRLALQDLLPQVDILSLHCPLTPETRGLIGMHELRFMKREALLINTARGGIIDEEALAAALRKSYLRGAAIDVLALEPPRNGNRLLATDIPRLIVTPHIA
jgi:glycerate dehydrogenase